MEKQKRWHTWLLLAVISLTLYNILPTVFFYSKPLDKPVTPKQAEEVTKAIESRVNALETEAVNWIKAYTHTLKLKPQSIYIDPKAPSTAQVTFKNESQARLFRSHVARAGALIPFVPAQLTPSGDTDLTEYSNTVSLERRIPIHLFPENRHEHFTYETKKDARGDVTPFYSKIVIDRAAKIAEAVGGASESGRTLEALAQVNPNTQSPQSAQLTLQLCQNLIQFSKIFGEDSPITKDYFSTFTAAPSMRRLELVDQFINQVDATKDQVRFARIAKEQQVSAKKFVPTTDKQEIARYKKQEETLSTASALIKKHRSAFIAGKSVWNKDEIALELTKSTIDNGLQTLYLDGRSAFFDAVTIDWNNETISLKVSSSFPKTKDTDQFLYEEIASLSTDLDEEIKPDSGHFTLQLSNLPGSKSFLALDLSSVAHLEVENTKRLLSTTWLPTHQDLNRENFPINTWEDWNNLSAAAQRLGIVIYAPIADGGQKIRGFQENGVYVIAKGLDKVLLRIQKAPDSDAAEMLIRDFTSLKNALEGRGFYGFSGSLLSRDPKFADDFIFVKDNYFQDLIKATREDFKVHGSGRYALLEFSTYGQRLLTLNRIETQIHEDLLKWSDDYGAARMSLKKLVPTDVPKPTKSPIFENLKLSFKKYFRGDDRKILRWGLDLSGGKTVQIELRDNNNKLVTDEADIKQGINELYKRVNKMGVSEVSIRQEGHRISLDFPGSQSLSASDLVKASSMQFNLVNEKFGLFNPDLSDSVNRFLKEVWNEAVVTGKKDIEEINMIAFKHLYGDALTPELAEPRSESAKVLFDNGLRLANPEETLVSSDFNERDSKIALLRGEDFKEWNGQSHPLLITFNNYALEGSSLQDVQASFDPSKGNFLRFGVKGSTIAHNEKVNPREDFFAWTQPFSKDGVAGTPNESFSPPGSGWRMAVILNGVVVSSPTLTEPLRDSASITGSFTQREVNQLEADLKAGSLTFTPRILSEKNVSPDLGAKEKSRSIYATAVSLLLVMGIMITYYRKWGVIASVAVLFNLLIIWATLQNLQAAISLAGIAAIILTMGMAVDANVLVFERIREEFNKTGRLASALHTGYKMAFSAIVDSNVTTIIAAMILLHFDSGPIKGFAVSLIIGIASSMFTALFMTRYYFVRWVNKPKVKKLQAQNANLGMSNWIKPRNFDFLKTSRFVILLSAIVMITGAFSLTKQKQGVLGMDFTGGSALTVEVAPSKEGNYRARVEKALSKAGIAAQEVEVRELTPSNHIRLFLSKQLSKEGGVLHNLDVKYADRDTLALQTDHPEIRWIVDTLSAGGVNLTSSSLDSLDSNWSDVSGQMSDTMRTNAIIGMSLALIAILFYITIRFEFKYAISATLCIGHDVLFALAAIAIMKGFGIAVQIDLHTVAALMTIVGYSLNDTIIVFDRIREDVVTHKKLSFAQVINLAVNTTLSRTLMTSITTLFVLIPLILFGGSTIFGFSLVMAVGVVFGTLSSLFIAAPLIHFFHKLELKKKDRQVKFIRT